MGAEQTAENGGTVPEQVPTSMDTTEEMAIKASGVSVVMHHGNFSTHDEESFNFLSMQSGQATRQLADKTKELEAEGIEEGSRRRNRSSKDEEATEASKKAKEDIEKEEVRGERRQRHGKKRRM